MSCGRKVQPVDLLAICRRVVDRVRVSEGVEGRASSVDGIYRRSDGRKKDRKGGPGGKTWQGEGAESRVFEMFTPFVTTRLGDRPSIVF